MHDHELSEKLDDNVLNEMDKMQYPFAFFENMDSPYHEAFAASSQFLDMGCELNIKSGGNEKVVNCTPFVETQTISTELGVLNKLLRGSTLYGPMDYYGIIY